MRRLLLQLQLLRHPDQLSGGRGRHREAREGGRRSVGGLLGGFVVDLVDARRRRRRVARHAACARDYACSPRWALPRWGSKLPATVKKKHTEFFRRWCGRRQTPGAACTFIPTVSFSPFFLCLSVVGGVRYLPLCLHTESFFFLAARTLLSGPPRATAGPRAQRSSSSSRRPEAPTRPGPRSSESCSVARPLQLAHH